MTIEERIEAKLRELFIEYDSLLGYLANYPRDEDLDQTPRIIAQIDVLAKLLDIEASRVAVARSIVAASCSPFESPLEAFYPQVQAWMTGNAGRFQEMGLPQTTFAQGECPNCGHDWTAHGDYISRGEKTCEEILQ